MQEVIRYFLRKAFLRYSPAYNEISQENWRRECEDISYWKTVFRFIYDWIFSRNYLRESDGGAIFRKIRFVQCLFFESASEYGCQNRRILMVSAESKGDSACNCDPDFQNESEKGRSWHFFVLDGHFRRSSDFDCHSGTGDSWQSAVCNWYFSPVPFLYSGDFTDPSLLLEMAAMPLGEAEDIICCRYDGRRNLL